jgi:hypothetical protein
MRGGIGKAPLRRQNHRHGRAPSLFADDPQRAAVQLGQPSRQWQAKPGAFVFARQPGVDLSEGLEGDLDLLRCHARAGVAYVDGDAAFLGAPRQRQPRLRAW